MPTPACSRRLLRSIPALRGQGSSTCLRLFLTALLCLAAGAPASATTIRRAGLDEIVSLSETIVRGRVTAVRGLWQGNKIVTEVTVAVSGALKGPRAATVSFHQLGGRVEQPIPLETVVPGAPVHRVGDDAYFFIERGKDGRRVLVGLSRGHAPVRQGPDGAYVIVGGKRLPPAALDDEVRRIVAGQSAPPAAPGTTR